VPSGGTRYGLQEHVKAREEYTTSWRSTVLSTGTRYGLGGTYLGLEEHTTAWRRTLQSGKPTEVYRNTLRPGRNILRSGGT